MTWATSSMNDILRTNDNNEHDNNDEDKKEVEEFTIFEKNSAIYCTNLLVAWMITIVEMKQIKCQEEQKERNVVIVSFVVLLHVFVVSRWSIFATIGYYYPYWMILVSFYKFNFIYQQSTFLHHRYYFF